MYRFITDIVKLHLPLCPDTVLYQKNILQGGRKKVQFFVHCGLLTLFSSVIYEAGFDINCFFFEDMEIYIVKTIPPIV